MRASILAVVVSVVTPLLLTSCSTEPQPSKSEIEQALAAQLPAFARVSRLSVEATENMGTKVEPAWHSRLRATVTVTSATFTPDGTDGRVVFLRVVKRDGETTELFWKSVSTLYEGKWRITFEGQPVESGLPESAFGQNVIIRGSKAEAVYLAEQAEQQRLAILVAQGEAEEQRQAEERERARADEIAAQKAHEIAIQAECARAAVQDYGASGKAARVGNDIESPRVLRTVRPGYPPLARRANVEGNVQVEVVVLPDGTVGEATVIKSLSRELDASAVRAAKQYRFEPGTKPCPYGPVPVPVVFTIELTFRNEVFVPTLRTGPQGEGIIRRIP